jgi:hypothetical protein
VIPIGSYIIATEAMDPALMDRLMPKNRIVSDSRKVVYYYRPSPDRKSILFGGRVSLSETDPRNSGPKLHSDLVQIFPELAETNSMAPIEEARFAKRLIGAVLDHLREHSGVKRFTVVCSRGNHGRLTKKKQFKNSAGTNLESAIYWDLADRYTEKQGWTWRIPPSGLAYFDIRNPDGTSWTCRGYHGEQCKYQGGVGGLTIPLNKLQARWDKTTRADFNLMGHFHTFSRPNSTTLLNGSLKGFDEYALELGFPYEPPIQTLAIYDPRWRMVTTVHPLFADR